MEIGRKKQVKKQLEMSTVMEKLNTLIKVNITVKHQKRILRKKLKKQK